MKSQDLKMLLANNPYTIAEILKMFNAHNIHIIEGKRIQFGLPENRSSRSHCIFLDKYLTHKDYPNGTTEDFISMVARLKKISYQQAISIILLFTNGGMRGYNAEECDFVLQDTPLTEYNKSVLDLYPLTISELFLKDGITPSTQKDFGIRFSDEYNRILIPIFQDDKLVGLFGRWNEKKFDEEVIPKYLPILPYQKGKVLFPYDMNKEYIRKSKSVFLVESEKTPMLTYKWDIRNILAIGGNCVKEKQVEMLKNLGVEKIILALDKGLNDGYIEFTALRLKEFGFRVYYIDVENIDYLPNKECVFDLNNKDLVLETIKKYMKEV